MSCIKKILELKGDKEYIQIDSNFVAEGGGEYKGYDYLVTFVRDHRCGYVALPPNHPLALTKDNDYLWDGDLEVHGGITFNSTEKNISELVSEDCGDRWLGFDAAHLHDLYDHEYCVKYGMEARESSIFQDGTVKDYSYMEQECKNLIDQLINNYEY